MWHEIFAGAYFCGLAIFCVLRELSFAIRTDRFFFLLGMNQLRFSESSQYYGERTLPKTSISLYSQLPLRRTPLGSKCPS